MTTNEKKKNAKTPFAKPSKKGPLSPMIVTIFKNQKQSQGKEIGQDKTG